MLFMVRYWHFGMAQVAVEADSKEEAKKKFNKWREKRANKDDYSEAKNAYELKVIR